LGVCLPFSTPINSTASPEEAETFVSIGARADIGWVGFGLGKRMAASLRFVLWLNIEEVVVSCRFAT